MSELKPCPFCGMTPKQESGFYYHAVPRHGGCILSEALNGQMFAAENWNTRAQPSLQEVLEAVKEFIKDREIQEVPWTESDLMDAIKDAYGEDV